MTHRYDTVDSTVTIKDKKGKTIFVGALKYLVVTHEHYAVEDVYGYGRSILTFQGEFKQQPKKRKKNKRAKK